MIYCKDKFNEEFLIDDNLRVKGTSDSGIKIIEMIIEKLEPFAPEKGSPTLIVINALKKNNFEVIKSELPIIEQLDNVVY